MQSSESDKRLNLTQSTTWMVTGGARDPRDPALPVDLLQDRALAQGERLPARLEQPARRRGALPHVAGDRAEATATRLHQPTGRLLFDGLQFGLRRCRRRRRRHRCSIRQHWQHSFHQSNSDGLTIHGSSSLSLSWKILYYSLWSNSDYSLTRILPSPPCLFQMSVLSISYIFHQEKELYYYYTQSFYSRPYILKKKSQMNSASGSTLSVPLTFSKSFIYLFPRSVRYKY